MYLIIDKTTEIPELTPSLTSIDKDDADMDIVTIIDLIGTPKKDLLKYNKGGSWEPIKIRE